MRRHGRWQQLLLDELETAEAVGVRALVQKHLGRRATRAEITAARRAARSLAAAGAAELIHVRVPGGEQHRGALPVAIRPGIEPDDQLLGQAALGEPLEVSSAAEQRRLSTNLAERTVAGVMQSANLARRVDVDNLHADVAANLAEHLRAPLVELAQLRGNFGGAVTGPGGPPRLSVSVRPWGEWWGTSTEPPRLWWRV